MGRWMICSAIHSSYAVKRWNVPLLRIMPWKRSARRVEAAFWHMHTHTETSILHTGSVCVWVTVWRRARVCVRIATFQCACRPVDFHCGAVDMPHRLENEQANHTVVAWGVAHTSYTIAWDYLLLYAEQHFSWTAVHILTESFFPNAVRCAHWHFPTILTLIHSFSCSSFRHDWHKMKLQYDRYTHFQLH